MFLTDIRKLFVLILASSVLITSCGGGGSSSGDTVVDDGSGNVICNALASSVLSAGNSSRTSPSETTATTGYSLSGRLSIAASVAVDSDVNDIYADYTSNDSPVLCQVVSNTATVQGFASAEATGGTISGYPSLERFATTPDEDDWYGITLQAGQSVKLQVVDYATPDTQAGDSYSGDLDLYLYAAGDTSTVVDYSNSLSEFESVSVSRSGSYLINVNAFRGISKYVLQFTPATSSEIAVQPMDDFVANQMIVKTADSTTSASAMMTSAGIQASVSKVKQTAPDRPALMSVSRSDAQLQALAGGSSTDPLRAFSETMYDKRQTLIDIKTMAQQAGVEYAEPNYIRQPLATPDDTDYSYQWHYPQINLPQAWNITTGTPDSGNVIVAVIDTGVYLAHPDLDDKISADGGYDFISATSIANDGDGIDSNPDDPGDSIYLSQSTWHGTHVAGTVGAESDNGSGVAGVSWGAKIMPLRALGVGGGTSYDIMQALYYAAGLANDSGTTPSQKADIINLSLGGDSYSSSEQAAYTAARNAGVIIVAAAGNASTATLYYPASYDGVISVSATDYNDELTSYSNYGSKIDIAAPGGATGADDNDDGYPDGIYSTYVSVNNASNTRSASYQWLQGTSMASPHVAGVLALMKAVYPALTPDQVDALISSCSITSKAGDSSCARDNQLGYGRIDAYAAVSEAYSLANGGSLPDPVVLESAPSTLSFAAAGSLDFVISNSGGEGDSGTTPSITSVVADDDWLTIAEAGVDAYGFGTYTATVSRDALNDGYYSTTVTATTAAGETLEIPAYMTVGTVSSDGEMTQQYVLLLDSSGNEVATAYAEENGSYSFTEVEAGTYYLTAGSDIDVDLIICQSGETCGDYPTLNSAEAITVNSDISGLDFQVSVISSQSSSTEVASTAGGEERTEKRSPPAAARSSAQ
ncbi:MAG: S8 family serine peptidase [Pseudomonadota bacterium]|nr:S8 family serine peptidase [Pseudomonadota bacterium]